MGCAAPARVSPPLSSTFSPEAGSAYVAGMFSRTTLGAHFALVIQSTDGKAEYVIPMGDDGLLPSRFEKKTIAVKVPAGSYVISQWITYSTMTKEVLTRQVLMYSALGQRFILEAGDVVHLGSFAARSSSSNGGYNGYAHAVNTNMQLQPLATTKAEVHSAFDLAYPRLSSQPFTCLLCTDSSATQ